MIDTPQMPKDALVWRDEINKHGDVRYLINTEPHSDHFSGNYFFGGIVVGHEGIREAIRSASVEQLRDYVNQIAPENPPLLANNMFK